jgi:L-threonylcarbamoyladenylate synthase
VKVWRFGEPVAALRACLDRGGLLAIPTESSYGLGADPGNPEGVAAVYRLKGRASAKPLPVVVASRDQLARLGIDPNLPILERLSMGWPGPLSALLPLDRPLPAAAGAGSLAVRIPGHPELRDLLAAVGPLTATSANRSGGEPIVDPDELPELLAGTDAVVVDGGVLRGGPPSTLVEPRPEGWRVLRQGSFDRARLLALGGPRGGEE